MLRVHITVYIDIVVLKCFTLKRIVLKCTCAIFYSIRPMWRGTHMHLCRLKVFPRHFILKK